MAEPIYGWVVDGAELRPLRIGETLDVAINIYRTHFLTLIKAVVVVVAPVQVLTAIVQGSAPDTPFGTFPDPSTDEPPDVELDKVWATLAAFLVVTILGVVAGQLATAASLKAVSEAYMGEEPNWRESLRFTMSRFWPLMWLALLTTVLLFLGLLACLAPGVYLYGAWAVVVPVLLLEDIRGRAALKRSRFLVRDRWWPTFGVVILGVLLVYAVSAAFGAVLGIVFFATVESEIVRLVASTIIGTAAGVLATPFSAALVAVVYFDLRVRKEGLDLELLARRMGVEPAGGARPAVLPPPVWPGPAQPPPPAAWPPPAGWAPFPQAAPSSFPGAPPQPPAGEALPGEPTPGEAPASERGPDQRPDG